MNTPTPPANPGFDSILAALIEAQEQAPDQAVDVAQWTDKYPQYADQIRSFFVNRRKLEAAYGQITQSTLKFFLLQPIFVRSRFIFRRW
jgi:hypothetical protein